MNVDHGFLSKSLAPDGTACKADTVGLLQRAYIIAGELRYIGKETDRKWEEGDDISVLEFKGTEYGRSRARYYALPKEIGPQPDSTFGSCCEAAWSAAPS